MPTVKDLLNDRELLNNVRQKLDPESARGSAYNWRGIADYLHRNEYIDFPDYEILEKCIGGGQNPATEFLDGLFIKIPSLTVLEFMKKAEQFGRNDIVVLLECEEPSERLKFINRDVRNRLEILLDKYVPTENSWKEFAEEYKFSLQEIQMINTRRVARKRYSPTECLFEEIVTQRPDLNLSFILEAAESLRRMDVYETITDTFPVYNDGTFRRKGDDEEFNGSTKIGFDKHHENRRIQKESKQIMLNLPDNHLVGHAVSNDEDKGKSFMIPIQESSQSMARNNKKSPRNSQVLTVFQVNLLDNEELNDKEIDNEEDSVNKLSPPLTTPDQTRELDKKCSIIEENVEDNDMIPLIVDLPQPPADQFNSFCTNSTFENNSVQKLPIDPGCCLCIIISNYKYKKSIPGCNRYNDDTHPASINMKAMKADVASCKEYFQSLSWDVWSYNNVSAHELMKVSSRRRGKYSCVLCILMSSGYEDQIYTTDGVSHGLNDFVATFNEGFKGIPKIILVQSIQQNSYEVDESWMDSLCSDETIFQMIPTRKKYTYMKKTKGSWFIQGFLSSMKRNGTKTSSSPQFIAIMQGILMEVLQQDEHAHQEVRNAFKKLGRWDPQLTSSVILSFCQNTLQK